MVEMAFRAYDPCLSCATHTLPGDMPIEIFIHSADGQIVDVSPAIPIKTGGKVCKTLVMGLGSPILCDDGIGLRVAARVREVCQDSDVTVLELG